MSFSINEKIAHWKNMKNNPKLQPPHSMWFLNASSYRFPQIYQVQLFAPDSV